MGETERKERKGRKVTELEYSSRKGKAVFQKDPRHHIFPQKGEGNSIFPQTTEDLEESAAERQGPSQCGQTLMILGICSFGVSSPKQASTPQNSRMEKTLEKSAMKALTWR